MPAEDIQALRIYHETRCVQEKRLARTAACKTAAAVHLRLFQFHRLMVIDLIGAG